MPCATIPGGFDGSLQPGIGLDLLQQPAGLDIADEFIEQLASGLAALRNRDRHMLLAPIVVQHPRAGQRLRHFEQDGLVGGVDVEFAIAQRVDRAGDAFGGRDFRVLESLRQHPFRGATFGDADTDAGPVDLLGPNDRGIGRNQIAKLHR